MSSRTAMLTLAGPKAVDVLTKLGATNAAGMAPGQHTLLQCGGSPTIIAAGRALGSLDFTLIADEAVTGDLWRSLVSQVEHTTRCTWMRLQQHVASPDRVSLCLTCRASKRARQEIIGCQSDAWCCDGRLW